MSKSVKPKGLAISRSGAKFTMTWKIGDADYGGGQQREYGVAAAGKKISYGSNKKIKVTDTKCEVELDPKSYYPYAGKSKIATVGIRVRGNRKKYKDKKGKSHNPGWSDWSPWTMTIAVPNRPTLSAALDQTLANRTTFTWDTSVSDTDGRWFTDVKYQSILVKGYNGEKPETLAWNNKADGWKEGTGAKAGSLPIDERTADIAEGSCTRWFRVWARGPAGDSAPIYASHTYAEAKQAQVESASSSPMADGAGMVASVRWDAAESSANPIDQTTVQYAIVTPALGLTYPAEEESSWTDANISADSKGGEAVRFMIGGTLRDDRCVFVRVNTQHDGITTRGVPQLASTGKLERPQLQSVETSDETFRVTVTAKNNSEVPGSSLTVLYLPGSDPEGAVAIGQIPAGKTSGTFQCPDWSDQTVISFGVYAAVEAGINRMISDTVWQGGDVPKPPGNVRISQTQVSGTVRVEWDWTWNEADGAEISWADHEDAWESTDEPKSYSISNLRAARWNISDLETGITWYIRVRLFIGEGDSITYGPWSEMAAIDLSSAPSIPVIALSDAVITEDGIVTASWGYSSTDGTYQMYAEVCDAVREGAGWDYTRIIAHTETAQHIDIDAKQAGWSAGQTHYLCVRVTSGSGRVSDGWSEPVAVNVAEPLEISVNTSLQVDEGELVLTELPLRVSATGAGAGGTTIIVIERADDYDLTRPDENTFIGMKGETIAQAVQTGEDEIYIGKEDLIGRLDDGAPYRIIATIRDGLGQTAQEEIDFKVKWEDQAVIPQARARIDQELGIAYITPIAPEDAAEGATCDIYRLSVDRPELIVEDAAFGETYVDPFPAIGPMGGHRVVYKTVNGDYITEDQHLAWIDLREEEWDRFDSEYNIIDFEDGQALFTYNTDLTNKFNKDFQRTEYLDGSVEGDWNAAVTRDADINTVLLVSDQEQIRAFRRLATSSQQCHVRTKEGSSYAADVQVQEGYRSDEGQKIATFTLKISGIDADGLDGVPLEEWRV